MLSDQKFSERAMKFCLLKNTEGKFFSIEDYKTAVKEMQTDKDGKLVLLYANDKEAQYSQIEAAKNKGYDVLWLDCQLDSYFVNMLETKIENCTIARVDSDSIENLIVKEEKLKPELSENDKKDLDDMFKAILPSENQYYVQADNLGEDAAPILITQSEFMRRYREMSSLGGGMNFYGEMPASYNITVNMQNPTVVKILSGKPAAGEEDKEKRTEEISSFAKENELLKQITDLALLSNGMLKGKALAEFVERSYKLI